MQVSVLGCGRWGSFIGWYLSEREGISGVYVYGRSGSPHLRQLRDSRRTEYLQFNEKVTFTDDLSLALSSDTIFISIAAQSLRSLMQQISRYNIDDKLIVLCMKGLEEQSGLRLSQVVADYTPCKTAVWVGPGHVQTYSQGCPGCMVIDSESAEVTRSLVHTLSGGSIRFYYGTDIIGSEVGAAAKNVMGIAAGMLDGAALTGLKGALMARGAREVSRLIAAMGGEPISAYGLAHLGDYEATLFSTFSRNRMFGEMFIKGERLEKLAEGVSTTRAMMTLAHKYGVELPITETIYNVIELGSEPIETMQNLFLRSIKEEF